MSLAVKSFLRSTAWIFAILVIIAAGVFYWSATSFENAAKLADDGVVGEAQVLESFSRRERKTSSSDGGVRYVTRYYVRYRFSPEVSDPISKLARVSKSFQEATRPGTWIPVTYLLSDPSIHEIEPGDIRETSWGTLFIGLLFLGLGIYIAITGWRNAARDGRLADHGQLADATIEVVKELPKNKAQLVYWFADAQGIRTRGTSRAKRSSAYDGFKPGDVVQVIFDPSNPKSNAWADELGIGDFGNESVQRG